ncbi:RHS repeat-associated core domain-containing protein [Paraburkholderia sediminicola]|uniref:RHS repeat-associated core domain-containing protein n=1 Tax=Paraburkholderia sediminicola TaxID=458836 RepID=UPI0038B9B766
MHAIYASVARCQPVRRSFLLFLFVLLSWFVAPRAHADDCTDAYVAAGAYPGDPGCELTASANVHGMACYNTGVIHAYCTGPSRGGTDEPFSPEGTVTGDGDGVDGNSGGMGGGGGGGGGGSGGFGDIGGSDGTDSAGGGGGCGGNATAGCGSSTSGGDPVNLYTGQFHQVAHDLHLADVIDVDLARVYRSSAYDTSGRPMAGAFGVGATFAYDSYLTLSAADGNGVRQRIELRLPSGVRIPFTVRAGSSTAWDNLTSPGEYYHASIVNGDRNGVTRVLTLRDGRMRRFTMINGLYRLSRVEDRNGNAVVIARDGATGAVISVTSPNGRALTFTSVSGSRGTPLVSRVTDPLNRQVKYQYDSQDRLSQVTDAAGGVWKYGWDSKSRLVSVTDPEGNLQVTSTYDDNDRVTFQKLADGSTFGFAYTFADGKVTQTDVTDRRGSIRRLAFDTNGRVVRNTYPAGLPMQQVQTFTYDQNGRVTNLTETDRQYTYAYDTNGNRISAADQYGTLVTRAFDSYSQLLTEAQAGDPQRGVSTVYTYDTNGNLLTITDRTGKRTTLTNDGQGRPLTVTDALKGVTKYAWTGPDLTGVTDALNRTTQFTTDAAGRVTAVQDPLGNKTARTLDALNRTTDITDALGGVTRFTWDRNGHLLSQADPKGVTTRYAYNTIGRPVSKTDTLGRSETYTWTPAGQLQSVTDRKGQVTGYTYDEAGRLKGTAFQPAAGVASTRRWNYSWDNTLDRLRGLDDYARAEPGGREGRTATTIFYYDSVTGKFVSTYEWPQQSGSWSYRYNALTRELDGIDMFGVTVTYSRDAEHRVTQIQSVENDEAPRQFGYGYDALGRLAQATLANGVTATYTWDAASQLTGITYKRSDGSVLGDLTYGYDLAGRRTKMGGSLAKVDLPQPVSDAQYNGANQLTRWAGKTFTYDLNGNLTGDGLNQYNWNLQGALGGITGATTAAFSYDASGRRRNMTVDGKQTRFVWIGDELNLILPDDDWSKRTRLFSPYPEGGLDELTYRRIGDDASKDRYVLRDGNNNVIALTDANQQIVTQYRYEPYGKTTLAGAADANPQQYTGRENDGTGLYYYRNRYYSPQTGRFISEDPVGWASGQTNAYAYVNGNPVSLYDPFGLWSISGGVHVVVGGQGTLYGDGWSITGVGIRGGIGLGGGFSIDPNGTVPSKNNVGSSVTVGGYGEASAGWGPVTGSIGYSRGVEVNQSGSSGIPGIGMRPYGGPSGSVTVGSPGSKGISACASAGLEMTWTRGR